MDMTTRKIWGWSAITLTAALMVLLRWLHIGVTHYNWFLVILIAWTLVMLFVFRYMGPDPKKDPLPEGRKGV